MDNIQTAELHKPQWLTIKPKSNNDFSKIKNALRSRNLTTVCEEAHCPNMAECWHNEGTATFMVMGDTCTRGCQFCAIKTKMHGQSLDPFEPIKLANAIVEMELDYAVITSVTRDDLIDGGASHFAQCISRIKKERPETKVEVLIPDFQGSLDSIKKIVHSKPDVIAHNIETVNSLQKKVRDLRANYEQSVKVLKIVKMLDPNIYTKSSIMIGVGETREEVIQAMKDLRSIGCDMLTIGQYLKPKNMRMKVVEYMPISAFEEYRQIGLELGFLYVASGPFVRSSYRAGELFMKGLAEKKN